MRIVIVDHSNGSEMPKGGMTKIQRGDLVINIETDGHASCMKYLDGKTDDVQVDVVNLEHIDEVSARISRKAQIERDAAKDSDDTYRMPVEQKIRNGLAPSGNSGTEEIGGA